MIEVVGNGDRVGMYGDWVVMEEVDFAMICFNKINCVRAL